MKEQSAIAYNQMITGLFDISDPKTDTIHIGNCEAQVMIFICFSMNTIHINYYN